jgi:branched-chain amino acid transport system substrate-binding protein
LAAANTLIHQDHVVALVSDYGDTDPAWNTMFEKAGIPIIGGSQAAPGNPNNPLFFTPETAESALTYAQLYGLKTEGATKIAYPYCAEVSQCQSGIPFAKQAAPLLGMSLVWIGAFSQSSPDLTPQCLAAKQAGANGAFPSAPLTNDIKFAAACYQQGFKPYYGMGGGQLDSSLLNIPAFNGTISAQGNAPWFEDSTPALQEFHAAMAKYAPNATLHDDAAILAWASGKLFQAAVAASGSSTVTSASILNGMYSLHNETLGGLAPALNFTRGKQAMPTCFFLAGIKNGKFVAPAGLNTAACAPAA